MIAALFVEADGVYAERLATPPAFRDLLLELARQTRSIACEVVA